jgi:putative cell wall-binding protein
MKDKEIIGLDIVDNKPDYTKTKEENLKIAKKRYEKAYGKSVADEIFKE